MKLVRKRAIDAERHIVEKNKSPKTKNENWSLIGSISLEGGRKWEFIRWG